MIVSPLTHCDTISVHVQFKIRAYYVLNIVSTSYNNPTTKTWNLRDSESLRNLPLAGKFQLWEPSPDLHDSKIDNSPTRTPCFSLGLGRDEAKAQFQTPKLLVELDTLFSLYHSTCYFSI